MRPSCRPKRRSSSARKSSGSRARRCGTASLRSVQTIEERCRGSRRRQRQDRERARTAGSARPRGPRGRARARPWRRCPIADRARRSSRSRPARAAASARRRPRPGERGVGRAPRQRSTASGAGAARKRTAVGFRTTPAWPRQPRPARRELAALDHVGEGLAGLDVAREGQEDRPDRVAEAAVGDHHVEDGLRAGAIRSQTPRASSMRRAAAAIA